MPKRKDFGRELWNRGIEFSQADINPIVYECHEWTLEKLFFLSNYMAQMTQAMVGNPNFSTINYVDLFAGSGICKKYDSSRRYPGSALLAALTQKPFGRIILVEKDFQKYSALCERVKRALDHQSQIGFFPINMEINSAIQNVIEAIPDRSLTLAFIDPYALDVDYETILRLTSSRAVDLLILFAVDTDLIQNVQRYYDQENSKLDKFLGSSSNWRQDWDKLKNRNAANLRELFASIYLRSLKEIGYDNSVSISIPRDSRPMYRLVFASKNPLGLKFWRIAEKLELGGNRGLFDPEL